MLQALETMSFCTKRTPVIIEGILEGSAEIPEFPLDGVIDLLQVLANRAKEEKFLVKTKKANLHDCI